MFNRNKNSDSMAKPTNNDPAVVNQIMAGTKIIGDIEATENIRIAGTLEGNLTTKGKLAVGKSGIIRGNIRCENSDVEGIIDGKIYVEELLSLKSTANIKGEIKTGKLAIEPGAVLNASCEMGGAQKPNEERKPQKPVK